MDIKVSSQPAEQIVPGRWETPTDGENHRHLMDESRILLRFLLNRMIPTRSSCEHMHRKERGYITRQRGGTLYASQTAHLNGEESRGTDGRWSGGGVTCVRPVLRKGTGLISSHDGLQRTFSKLRSEETSEQN